MKYTKQQRLDIGKRIYDGEITRYQAAEIYDISDQTAREYRRLYRDTNSLPGVRERVATKSIETEEHNLDAYQDMSKDQLIQELVRSRIREARLKKNYEVMEDGTVIHYTSKKNTR